MHILEKKYAHLDYILWASLTAVTLVFLSVVARATNGSAWSGTWANGVDLSGVNASFIGETSSQSLGTNGNTIRIINDVNGDGIKDVLLAAWGHDSPAANTGKTYLIFGKTSGWSMNTTLASSGNYDASFIGEAESDQMGNSIDGIGDVNGDGYGDFAIAALGNDEAGSGYGQVYLLFGKANGWQKDVVVSTTANASLQGISAGGQGLGRFVNRAGDVNADGFGDFLLCDSTVDYDHQDDGHCYLVYGKVSGWTMDQSITSSTLTTARFDGDEAVAYAGNSAAALGDVNGDGKDDFAIAASAHDGGQGADANRGEVYIFFGKTSGWSGTSTAYSVSDASFIGETNGDYFGSHVFGIGDVNGDSIHDIAIYATGSDTAGKVYIFFGKTSGWTKRASAAGADASFFGAEAADQFGAAVAAGDFNNDRYNDIAVGASRSGAAASQAGQTYIIFGKNSGWTTNVAIANGADASFWGEEASDNAGNSLSGGDVNNDGADDLLIGANGNDENGSLSGQVYLVFPPTPPTVTIAASQVMGGTGLVSVTTTVNDVNRRAESLRLTYRSGASCATSTAGATLGSAVTVSVADSLDVPAVSNSAEFQIGLETGKKITTLYGANTVGFTWNSLADTGAANGTYCLAATVTDGNEYSEVATTTLTIDNAAPSAPGIMTVASVSASTARLAFGAVSSDTNFSQYKIRYATNTPVTAGSPSFTSAEDINLANVNFSGASSSTVTSLAPNSRYYFNIFAYDTYGNIASSTAEASTTTLAVVPSALTASETGSDRLTLSWSNHGNPDSTEYAVQNETTGSVSDWEAGVSRVATGLSCGEAYSFRVKARNAAGLETAYGTSQSLFTAGCASQGGGGNASPPETIIQPKMSEQRPDEVVPIIITSEVSLQSKSGAPNIFSPVEGQMISRLPFAVEGYCAAKAEISVRVAGSLYIVECGDEGIFSAKILDQIVPGKYSLIVTQTEVGREASAEVRLEFFYAEQNENAATSQTPESEIIERPAQKKTGSSQELNNETVSDTHKKSNSPAVESVAEIMAKAEQRQAFLLVVPRGTAQFKKAQISEIEGVGGEIVRIYLKPDADVHSITARVYAEEEVIPEVGNTRREGFLGWFGITAVNAAEVAPWISMHAFQPLYNSDIYYADILLSERAGRYRLRVTLNPKIQNIGQQVKVEKNIVVVPKAIVSDASTGAPIRYARVSVYAKEANGEFRIWPSSLYGGKNPIETDAAGAYSMALPAGAYFYKAEATGYAKFESPIIIRDEPFILLEDIKLQTANVSWWDAFWQWVRRLLGL